jgi:EAL domain-containing protein (putative c-di-GMP-specific phosphodiesterase class I)
MYPAAMRAYAAGSTASTFDLPVLSGVLDEVRDRLEHHGYLGLVLIDLSPLSVIEIEHGRAVYDGLLQDVARLVDGMRSQILRSGERVSLLNPSGEEMVIFLEGARTSGDLGVDHLGAVVDRIGAHLYRAIGALVRPYRIPVPARIGQSLILANRTVQPERLVYRALREALASAQGRAQRWTGLARERLRAVIASGSGLSTVFQPLVELSSGRVRAHEALTRGPAGTDLEGPVALFDLAMQAGLSVELDLACLGGCLRSAGALPAEDLVFVNVLPPLLHEPSMRRWIVESFDPRRLVIELSESMAVGDYDGLLAGFAELRAHGVRFAVDDLGTGYASLDHVLHLSPEFLKLDRSLVAQLRDHGPRQAAVRGMAQIARELGAVLIAEGVEDATQAGLLSDLGVDWAQGYAFGHPMPWGDPERGALKP